MKEREDLVNPLLSLHPRCLWLSARVPESPKEESSPACPPPHPREQGCHVALSPAGASGVHSGGSHVFRVP